MANPVQLAQVLCATRVVVQQLRELASTNLRGVVNQTPEDYRAHLAVDLLQPLDNAFAAVLTALLTECQNLKITDADRLAHARMIEAAALGVPYVEPTAPIKK